MNLKPYISKRWSISFSKYSLILLCLLLLQSCFRFRTSDKKTIEYFSALQVENKIDYYRPSNTEHKIRVVSTFKGDTDKDTAVFFIHGAPGSADNYHAYLKDTALLNKAALYSIDRPGYGYSRFGKAIKSIEEQTRIISEVIDSIEQKNVIVVGHSYGGPIAAYASLKTDKVKGVLMLAPAIDPENEKVFWFAYIAKWKLTKWMVPGAFSVAGDEKFSHIKELEKIRDIWGEIKVPVIHVHGTKDIVVPFENIDFSKRSFNSDYLEIIELEKENHFLPWSREPLVKDLIHRLLNQKSAEQAIVK